jgi:hypothetical protein
MICIEFRDTKTNGGTKVQMLFDFNLNFFKDDLSLFKGCLDP